MLLLNVCKDNRIRPGTSEGSVRINHASHLLENERPPSQTDCRTGTLKCGLLCFIQKTLASIVFALGGLAESALLRLHAWDIKRLSEPCEPSPAYASYSSEHLAGGCVNTLSIRNGGCIFVFASERLPEDMVHSRYHCLTTSLTEKWGKIVAFSLNAFSELFRAPMLAHINIKYTCWQN